jgi:hypothetical protein
MNNFTWLHMASLGFTIYFTQFNLFYNPKKAPKFLTQQKMSAISTQNNRDSNLFEFLLLHDSISKKIKNRKQKSFIQQLNTMLLTCSNTIQRINCMILVQLSMKHNVSSKF